MEWTQFIIMLVAMIGLFSWNRAETRNDARHMDNKMEANRKETSSILLAIQQEMKDFHGKLEKQDAEFKSHLLYDHQERNKKL